MADLPPLPPDATPVAAIVAPARQQSEPVVAESNGYSYTVNGNLLLPSATIVESLAGAEDPKAAVECAEPGLPEGGLFSDRPARRRRMASRSRSRSSTAASPSPTSRRRSRPSFVAWGSATTSIGRRSSAYPRWPISMRRARACASKIDFAPGRELGGQQDHRDRRADRGRQVVGRHVSASITSAAATRVAIWRQGAAVVRPGDGFEVTANYSARVCRAYRRTAAAAGTARPRPAFRPSRRGGCTARPTRAPDTSIGRVLETHPDGTIDIAAINGTQLPYADETVATSRSPSRSRTRPMSSMSSTIRSPLPISSTTSCPAGRISASRFAILGENASFRVGMTVSQGISARAGTLDPAGPGIPDPRFTLIQGNLGYTQSLPHGYSASFTWSGQWADATLPQNQQWVLGGLGNLTAWLPAVLVGDSGMLARASLFAPPWARGELSVSGTRVRRGGRGHVATSRRPTLPVFSRLGRRRVRVSRASLKTGTTATSGVCLARGRYRNLDQRAQDSLNRANLYFNLSQSF